MACEALKAKYDKMYAEVLLLRSEAEEGVGGSRLHELEAQLFALGQDYALCMVANQPPFQTVINLNGKWADGGIPGPVISVNGNSIAIDMSAYKRPTAVGNILGEADIWVSFPDDKPYVGKLQPPNMIIWSNNSGWSKVSSGDSGQRNAPPAHTKARAE